MTRWLDAEQQRAWRALISVAMRLPAALDTQLQRDQGLTHFEYFVLSVLSESVDRRLKLSALAAGANASLSRLSHVVTKLERAGFVRRETVAGERGAWAVLTDAGFDQVVSAAPDHVETVRALIFDGLDDADIRALTEVGEAMVAQLDRGIASSG
ncbi:MAG TPA: MarR family transcriptional regulator [Aldersonia sp.]